MLFCWNFLQKLSMAIVYLKEHFSSLKQFANGIWSAVIVAYICRGCDNSAVERRTLGLEFQFEPHDCWVVSLSKNFKLPKVPVNTKEAATPPKHDRKIVDTGVKN